MDEGVVSYKLVDKANPNPAVEDTVQTLPFGLCVWAAGTAPRPLTSALAGKLGAGQVESVKKTGRLLVDPFMRAIIGTHSNAVVGGSTSEGGSAGVHDKRGQIFVLGDSSYYPWAPAEESSADAGQVRDACMFAHT